MASPTSSALRRALLYVPASSPRFLTKSLSLTADNITYDLEDSVTPPEKTRARTHLRAHLLSTHKPPSIGEIAVRVNAVSTPYIVGDLLALAPLPGVSIIVVPKVSSAADLLFVSDVLRRAAPSRYEPNPESSPNPDPELAPSSSTPPPPEPGKPIKLLALIESARAVMDLASICQATPELEGLIFAAEDFALDLSLTRTAGLSEFLYARSAIVTAARAFELPSVIDLVCTSYRGGDGLERLREECRSGKGMGFNGKQCIHPTQVETVQVLFSPDEEEVEWSVRVAIADDKASARGRGAWTLDGKMIDAPVVGRARAIIDKAEKCGFDIQGMREKWHHQEPK